MALQEHLERLEPFIGDGETRIDGYATGTEIGVLTDRQLISLKATDGDESTTTVNATYLDRMGGATITHRTAPEYYEDRLVYGIISLFVAVVSIALIGSVDGEAFSALLLLVGVGVGLLGLVLLVEAYDTPDDSVVIELQTAHGDVARRVRLGEEYTEFAETLSKTVSTAHASDREAQRTIG